MFFFKLIVLERYHLLYKLQACRDILFDWSFSDQALTTFELKDKETKAHKNDETMCHTLKDRVPSALLQGTRLFLLLFRS